MSSEYDDNYFNIHWSPNVSPNGLVILSPNAPINYDHCGYNTFENVNDYDYEENNHEYADELYTKIGGIYRQFCFSKIGIHFTIILNVVMVLINTFLIIYEIILMIKTNSFTTYDDLQLPIIYTVFDIVLTLILLFEIGAKLIAIYHCHVMNYFNFSHEHKIDILVFFLSLFLCILYIFDAFQRYNDMDNIGFLMLRIIRDIMRFVRLMLFARILYDSIIQLQLPKKTISSHSPFSSDIDITDRDDLKIDNQHKYVCL